MNSKKDTDIARLLEKFYAAETTLREEKSLKEYFASGDFPEDLQAEADYFDYLQEARQEGAQKRPIVFMEPKREQKVRAWIRPLMAAASLILIISVAGIIYQQQSRRANDMMVLQSEEDMDLAYQETKKALLMISGQLKKGEAGVQELSHFDQAVNNVKQVQP
jgi:hypothetical protein